MKKEGMDIESAWSSVADDGVVESYVDAMGHERSETTAAMPPPSLSGGGMSAVSFHRLDLHTGQTPRPSKNGDSMEPLFDSDLDRPDALLNATADSRLRRVVDHNREGVQDAAHMETQQMRRADVYDGYNVSLAALSRRPKVQTPTNRSVQEVTVYGAEHRDEGRRAHDVSVVPTRKAGLFDGTVLDTQGRTSTVAGKSKLRSDATHTHMGGEDTMERDDAGRGRGSDVHGERLHKRVRVSTNVATPMPPRNLKTATEARGGRTDVALNARDDVAQTQGRRVDGDQRASTSRASYRMGDADSAIARQPFNKTSFTQSVVAAAHVMGDADSTATRDVGVVQPGFALSSLRANIVSALKGEPYASRSAALQQRASFAAVGAARSRDSRSDDRRRLDPSLQQRGDHVALPSRRGRDGGRDDARRGAAAVQQRGDVAMSHSERGRDARSDSTPAGRVGPMDSGVDLRGRQSQPARRSPDDVVHSLLGFFGRGRTYDPSRADAPDARLNSRADADVFLQNKRMDTTTMFSAIRGSLSKVFGRADSTTYTTQRTHDADQHVYLPNAQAERHLNDDSLGRTHDPLTGGNLLNAPMAEHEFQNTKKETATTVRPNSMSIDVAHRPSLVYNGHRT